MKKVLLVSASKAFLQRNMNLLMTRGFQLLTATGGAEALKLHKEYFFDLILADLELEGMDGNRFCSLLRAEENLRHVPVILICHNISSSIERVKQSNASAIIMKPIDPIQLVETIGRFIDVQIGRNKRVVLKVVVISKNYAHEFTCFSHDLSTTGILIETEYHLELCSRIVCRFSLPGSCQIETAGEVVRSLSTLDSKCLYGIKFFNLPLSCRRGINDYVASQSISTDRARAGMYLSPHNV